MRLWVCWWGRGISLQALELSFPPEPRTFLSDDPKPPLDGRDLIFFFCDYFYNKKIKKERNQRLNTLFFKNQFDSSAIQHTSSGDSGAPAGLFTASGPSICATCEERMEKKCDEHIVWVTHTHTHTHTHTLTHTHAHTHTYTHTHTTAIS